MPSDFLLLGTVQKVTLLLL